MMWINVLKRFALGATAALAIGFGAANAMPTQLGIAIDGSGSVVPSDFTLQIDGLAAALEALPVDSTVEITVVQFANGAQVEVSPTLIDSDATLASVVSTVQDINQLTGFTNTAAAIDLVTSELMSSTNFSSNSVINISTDGETTAGSDPLVSAIASQNAGVGSLTAEAIGSFSTTELQTLVFAPGAAPNTGSGVVLPENSIPGNPLNPLVSPFVVPVSNFSAYGAVIDGKIQAIVDDDPTIPTIPTIPTADVPEPGAVALIGIGILAFGFVQLLSRRRVNRDSNALAFA